MLLSQELCQMTISNTFKNAIISTIIIIVVIIIMISYFFYLKGYRIETTRDDWYVPSFRHSSTICLPPAFAIALAVAPVDSNDLKGSVSYLHHKYIALCCKNMNTTVIGLRI